jgi:hypothetical protein
MWKQHDKTLYNYKAGGLCIIVNVSEIKAIYFCLTVATQQQHGEYLQ